MYKRQADYDTRVLTLAEVNRPALQLAGFYNYFDPKRLQIIGRVESTYLELKTEAERRQSFEQLMKYDISALVLCHGAAAFPECLEMAEKYDCNVFTTSEDTSDFMANVISSLHTHLAPRTTVHGVLVEVHGEGVLLTGDSGIGKSETALELIKRGHRLIADDSVIIKNINDQLIGKSPEKIRYYMEIRGIGIINIQRMFGPGAVRPDKGVDIIAELSQWEQGKTYDRIGINEQYDEVLGINVQKVVIPVTPGRNIPIVLETAARKFRLKQEGYDPASDLMQSVFGSADGD